MKYFSREAFRPPGGPAKPSERLLPRRSRGGKDESCPNLRSERSAGKAELRTKGLLAAKGGGLRRASHVNQVENT